MFRIIPAFGLALAFVLFSTGVLAEKEEYNVNPGMWETTYKMEISGVSPEMAKMMQQQPRVERECVKDRMIDFTPDDMDEDCKVRTTRHSAGKVSWEIMCTGKDGSSIGRGEASFNGDTTSGWFEMNSEDGPMGPMKMRNEFRGKRIGSC